MNENPPSDSPPSAPENAGKKSFNWSSPLFLWPATIVLAVLLYFGLKATADFLTHESTDDAFIAGHVVSIAPRIAGQVAAVHVLDNQLVRLTRRITPSRSRKNKRQRPRRTRTCARSSPAWN